MAMKQELVVEKGKEVANIGNCQPSFLWEWKAGNLEDMTKGNFKLI